jgi:hypothetical protein
LLAAAAWVWSSKVHALYLGGPIPSPGFGLLPRPKYFFGKDRKGQQIELIGTLELQSKWNGYAALLAAGAAVFQALSMLWPNFAIAL